MAVCVIGRETIERFGEYGAWLPVDVEVPIPHDGPCEPAIMATIELVGPHHKPTGCHWCAWEHNGALYLIGGMGCCEVHVERAMREITTFLAATEAARTVSIQTDLTIG